MYINCTSEKDRYGCRDVCKVCGFDGGVQDASPAGREGLLIGK
jgi:hypothetical protein